MKFNIKNSLSIGGIILAVATVLTLISFIIFNVNATSAGYFQGVTSGTVTLCSILAIIFGIVAFLLPALEAEGILGKILSLVQSLLLVGMALLILAALFAFISTRAQGLAYILASDINVRAEIQTAENMASATSAIVGFVFYGITLVVALVSTFFGYGKKEEKTAEAAA